MLVGKLEEMVRGLSLKKYVVVLIFFCWTIS